MSQIFHIQEFESIDSTNLELKRQARTDASDRCVVRAFEQTGGYGRQGRSWVSPYGGLYQSMLLRPDVETQQLPTLALVAALAAYDALLCVSSFDEDSKPYVKWPNDIICSQGKLGGISLEAHQGSIILGMGINIFASDMPLIVGGKNSPAYLSNVASSLDFPIPENDEKLTSKIILDESQICILPTILAPEQVQTIRLLGAKIIDVFACYYEQWIQDGFEPFVKRYRSVWNMDNVSVRIKDIYGVQVIEGRVKAIDEQGRLIVQTKQGIQTVSSGEVHLL